MVKRDRVYRSSRKLSNMSLIAVLLVMLMVIGGCSSSANDMASNSKANTAGNSELANVSTQSEALPAVTEDSKAEGNSQETGASTLNSAAEQRKLIYQANLVMEVQDYEASKQRIQDMIHLSGGYILEFNDQYSEYERAGLFKIKVPAQGFQSMLEQLNKLEHLRYERSYSATDVTEEYVDLEARLKVAKVEEERLLSFMEQAKNTSDLLKFSEDLTASQEKIERIQGRINYLNQNVSMSTIELRLYETIMGAKTSALEQTFGERLGKTLQESVKALIDLLQGLVLLLTAMLPFLVVIALVGLPVAWLVRKSNLRRQERHNQRQLELQERNKHLYASTHQQSEVVVADIAETADTVKKENVPRKEDTARNEGTAQKEEKTEPVSGIDNEK